MKGLLRLENPARRLYNFQYKKCNSDGLALNVFIVNYLTNTFCRQQIVFNESSPCLNVFSTTILILAH